MKLYGKKIIKNAMEQRAGARVESRDAICWDVLPAQRIARVKIQGSNEYVIAHYPINWDQTPVWLKASNAVRITHTGGIRARVELAGHGTYIPTPVSGSASPTPGNDSDGIVSGCQVTPTFPSSMDVNVASGETRISGESYYPSGATKTIDAAPGTAGLYRYDMIVVGSDNVYDYVKGAESSNPVLPTVPTNHVECGRILLFYGMTVIDRIWINRAFATPVESTIYMTPADNELAWAELTTEVEIGVKDQYGNLLAPATTWDFTVSFEIGNGNVEGIDAPGSYSESIATNHFHVTYTRAQLATDKSPILKASLAGLNINLINFASIKLLDSSGNPMY